MLKILNPPSAFIIEIVGNSCCSNLLQNKIQRVKITIKTMLCMDNVRLSSPAPELAKRTSPRSL